MYILYTYTTTTETPEKKTKKQLKQEKIQSERKNIAIKSNKWIQKNRLKKCNLMNENGLVEIPIDWMLHPTPDMNARERIESRVRNIFDSIGKYGVQPKRFVSLMWKEDLVARGFDPENPKFDPSIALGPVPMYTIVGDHTSAGLQRWHGLKPNNIKFQKACVEMVVSEKTEETLTLIRHAGTTENTI